MDRQSEAEVRALDAQCASPTSTQSRRAVVRLAALSPDEKSFCIIHYALFDYGNLVRCAIAAGVSADTRWVEPNAPVLCLAAQAGSVSSLTALLAAGANHALACAKGLTAAMHTAYFGRTACLRLLIEAGAQLEARTQIGLTALHLAAQQGQAEACQLLLSAGASVAARMPNGATALHKAAKQNHVAIINLLVAAGAELEAKSDAGRTPLADAAFEDHAESVAALLTLGADPNTVNVRSHTPLMNAIAFHHMSVVPALLPVTDTGITNHAGYNAFHVCVQTANEKCFRLLLPRMDDVNVRTVRGVGDDGAHAFDLTALHIACEKGQHKMVKALLRRGASRMARDSKQFTPLHHAAWAGQLSCMVHLLGKPGDYKLTTAEVNATDADACTPLHYAACNGHMHCCGALLAAGARLDPTDAQGFTPVMIARQEHPANAELLSLLSGRGPADAPGTTCNHCGAREVDTQLRACSGCLSVRFCSAACSSAAWPAHEEECRRRQAEREECTKVRINP